MVRLRSLCRMGGAQVDETTLARAIDVIIHLERGPRVAQIVHV